MKKTDRIAVLESGFDIKSRRRTNMSAATANLSAADIENGVTLERLETCGVPVLLYRSQLTIHGVLPDFDATSHQVGYRAVTPNKNGSIGVRYVAIDGEKKKTIVKVARLGELDSSGVRYRAALNSQGLSITASFEEREECLEALRSFPRDLFVGSVAAFACQFGGYLMEASVLAVREAQVWPLINRLWRVASLAEFEALFEAKEAEREKELAKWRAESAAKRETEEYEFAAFVAELDIPALEELDPTVPGVFLRAFRPFGSAPTLARVELKKRGAYFCQRMESVDGFPPISGSSKWSKVSGSAAARWRREFKEGRLFRAVTPAYLI